MRDWREYLKAQEIKMVAIDALKPYANNPRLAQDRRLRHLPQRGEVRQALDGLDEGGGRRVI